MYKKRWSVTQLKKKNKTGTGVNYKKMNKREHEG